MHRMSTGGRHIEHVGFRFNVDQDRGLLPFLAIVPGATIQFSADCSAPATPLLKRKTERLLRCIGLEYSLPTPDLVVVDGVRIHHRQ